MSNGEDEVNEQPLLETATSTKRARTDTLWLDTIRRDILDFDFEKLCSVSLTNVNVYACLVCGKYFQGIPFSVFCSL
jgi:U4/U6.U5 tri-snRNP-associated protein 2